MLVTRTSIVAKVACEPEVEALLKEFVEWRNHPHSICILQP